MKKYKLGGVMDIPAELEGGEFVETPQGELLEVKGPKHKDGGVKTALPENSFVYSDTIEGPDGKTMAERKEAREKQLKKVIKESNDPFNMIARNTVERTLAWAAQEDIADRLVMELNNELETLLGTGKYETGGPVTKRQVKRLKKTDSEVGVSRQDLARAKEGMGALYAKELFTGDMETSKRYNDMLRGVYEFEAEKYDPIVLTNEDRIKAGMKPKYKRGGKVKEYQGGGYIDPIVSALSSLLGSRQMAPVPRIPTGIENEALRAQESPRAPLLETLFNSGTDVGSTAAGLLPGPIGLAVGTFGPLLTTIANRLTDGENRNPYQGYGQQALGTNTQAQNQLGASRDAAIAQNALTYQDQATGIRNNTSSSSVARAATQSAAAGRMRADTQATATFADRLSNILSERARMQLNIDDKVMGGADLANERTTQDRDNFFTNLNSDVRNVAKGLMTQGGQNIDILKLLGL